MATILVLHGPNLNLLGKREPHFYGSTTLDDINATLTSRAKAAGHTLESLQSNAEHVLIDKIHQTTDTAWIIINPAAFTHTSVALRDALSATALPFIEVHLSNVHAREDFRQDSFFSDLAEGVITGLGADGYELALEAVIRRLADAHD